MIDVEKLFNEFKQQQKTIEEIQIQISTIKNDIELMNKQIRKNSLKDARF